MLVTATAPTTSSVPATIIMLLWLLPTSDRMLPPNRAAMICDKHKVPLKCP